MTTGISGRGSSASRCVPDGARLPKPADQVVCTIRALATAKSRRRRIFVLVAGRSEPTTLDAESVCARQSTTANSTKFTTGKLACAYRVRSPEETGTTTAITPF